MPELGVAPRSTGTLSGCRWAIETSTRSRRVMGSLPSFGVEYLLHCGPPFTVCPRGEGFLHGVHDRPPLLGSGISSHFAHVCFEVGAVILEIREQEAVLVKDRVVSDITARDGGKHLWPCLVMEFPVIVQLSRPDANDLTESL